MTTKVLSMDPRRRIAAALGALMVTLCLGIGAARADTAAADAADFLRQFGDRTAKVLADNALSAAQRESELRKLLVANFDVARIGRFVLGRYWRKASDPQRAEFGRLFEAYIVANYGQRLESYSGERLEVGVARSYDAKRVVVSSRIVRPKGPPVQAEWRLRRAANGWRIVDVVVEGVSLAITQRSEFGAVIQANGGRIEALLAKLREQAMTARARAAGKVASSN
ncbi:MAG: phospholipid-binding protein MlaC [Kiloniellaceae bacterium]